MGKTRVYGSNKKKVILPAAINLVSCFPVNVVRISTILTLRISGCALIKITAIGISDHFIVVISVICSVFNSLSRRLNFNLFH